MKLAVEVREVGVAGERISLGGVANNMPCTVEVTPHEMLGIARMMLKRSVLKVLLAGLRQPKKPSTKKG
jgi:hypothetical protein